MEALDKLTLKAVLDRSERLFTDRPALSFVDGEPMTYGEFAEQVRALSGLLHQRGVRPGDRVAILSTNMPNWGVAYFAVTTMGAVVVPILPDFHDSAVQHILLHSEAKAIFVSEKLMGKLEDVEFPDLESVIRMEDLHVFQGTDVRERIREKVRAGRAQLDRLRQYAMERLDRRQPDIDEDDLASIIYTSGTTGHSKGVMLSHKNIVYDAQTTADLVEFTPEERMVSVLPLAHTYECTLGLVIPLFYGASVHYLQKPPTPRTLLPALEKVKPTFLLVVPLIIEKIFKNKIQPKLRSSSLMRGLTKFKTTEKALHRMACKKLINSFGGAIRCMCIGGAPLSPEVERFLFNGGFPYSVGYGMTETAPMVTGADPREVRFRACGYPIPGVEIKIINPHPETGEGEILVRGPVVMQGYFKAPHLTREVFRDGWLKTGDLGIQDKDGFLYIKGRCKNVVIGASGENIYPEEIEALLNEKEYVLESLVYSHEGKLTARVHLDYELLDKLHGFQKMIESEVRDKLQERLEALRQEVNGMVSSFARIIKIIEHPEPFEKTPTQKIKRYLYVDPKENGLVDT
ncbi:AMP-binding protein [Paucidesulfovibrio longus]|uniref:AMP-binding protein n=1 Tax=Paucidesulfovibrio longus TaxID=889 RepID=UPI0003B5F830|nr:AMP-binding protein [Paucidesulfovibrio longus]